MTDRTGMCGMYVCHVCVQPGSQPAIPAASCKLDARDGPTYRTAYVELLTLGACTGNFLIVIVLGVLKYVLECCL